MTLNPCVQQYWENYLNSLAPRELPQHPYVEAAPAGDFTTTDALIELYLSGRKTAGSSLVEDFNTAGDPLPKVGNFWIVLDSTQTPRLILKTVKTEIHLFGNIPAAISIAEGEGDLTPEDWRHIHAEIYTPHLEAWGIEDINQAHVITEHFEIVWR